MHSPQLTENYDDSACYEPGEEIEAHCHVSLFRLFCEDDDEEVSGFRMIQTVVSLSLISGDKHSSIEVIRSDDLIPQHGSNTTSKHTHHAKFRLRLFPEHNRAHLMCTVRPDVVLPNIKSPVYGQWLSRRVNYDDRNKLTQSSKPIELCVSGDSYKSDYAGVSSVGGESDDEDVLRLTVRPSEVVSCTSPNPIFTPTIKVYEVTTQTLVKSRQLNWSVRSEEGTASLTLPGDSTHNKIYRIHCEIHQLSLKQLIIVRVRDYNVRQLDMYVGQSVMLCISIATTLVLLLLHLIYPGRIRLH
uniref:Uncharacterized protein n=1 Tax=Trichobilharzia regenti TaxID=157069 RepID=A0AA85K6U5_TRIRE|nr:unnamed protein product [Trichobilharzia regenti]